LAGAWLILLFAICALLAVCLQSAGEQHGEQKQTDPNRGGKAVATEHSVSPDPHESTNSL
jgi:hypothetical protein